MMKKKIGEHKPSGKKNVWAQFWCGNCKKIWKKKICEEEPSEKNKLWPMVMCGKKIVLPLAMEKKIRAWRDLPGPTPKNQMVRP